MINSSLPPIEKQANMTLYQAYKSRKEKEAEVNKIHNRIRLLEQEKEKTSQQIWKTNTKAFNVFNAKLRHKQDNERREMLHQRNKDKPSTYTVYMDQHLKTAKSKSNTALFKLENANNLKVQLKTFYQQKLNEEQKKNEQRRENANQIKYGELKSLTNVREQRDQLRRQIREDIKNQIEQELSQKLSQENLLRMLDTKEEQLVQQLKESQLHQKLSMDLYKQATILPVEEFKNLIPKVDSTRSYMKSSQTNIIQQ